VKTPDRNTWGKKKNPPGIPEGAVLVTDLIPKRTETKPSEPKRTKAKPKRPVVKVVGDDKWTGIRRVNLSNMAVRHAVTVEESRFALNGIALTKRGVEATNGHIAITTTYAKPGPQEDAAFDVDHSFNHDSFIPGNGMDWKKKLAAIKKRLGRLGHDYAIPMEQDDNVEIWLTPCKGSGQDPASMEAIGSGGVGKFPNIEMVDPGVKGEDEAITYKVNANYLIAIGTAVKEFLGATKSEQAKVDIQFLKGGESVIRFAAHNEETDQDLTAFLMPLNK